MRAPTHPMSQQPDRSPEKTPLWRDERFWTWAIQIAVLLAVFGVLYVAVTTAVQNQAQRGVAFDYQFNFLRNTAGFNIGETVLPYDRSDSFGWAMVVGFANSLRLIGVGLVLTTVLGVLVGVASFSKNWLLRQLSLIYVELLRNVPPLLQFVFWYFVVFFGLSKGSETAQVLGGMLVSKKGIWIPWFTQPAGVGILLLLIGVGVGFWRKRIWQLVETGRADRWLTYGLVGIGVAATLIGTLGLGWQAPQAINTNGDVTGGLRMSLEYGGMLMGLACYNAAFIAEIVRSGIQSVSKGQWEAAQSLGLSAGQTMQQVVFPQALRVIVPSLNTQYATLAKNSSLAIAIGYPDLYSVALTTQNQTGRAIEIVLLMGAVYLGLNLMISVVMNQVNRLVQLRER
jgi:general L-amino acid transport system permease protein